MHLIKFPARPGARRAFGGQAATVILMAGVLGGCGGTGAGSPSIVQSASPSRSGSPIVSGPPSASASGFTVVSTLLGLTDVPRRIRWVATPSAPVSDVKEVDFLI